MVSAVRCVRRCNFLVCSAEKSNCEHLLKKHIWSCNYQPFIPLSVCLSVQPPPPTYLKLVSSQLRTINPFYGHCCCCTLVTSLRSTQTTAGLLMTTPPCLAACQAEGHFIELCSSIISFEYTLYFTPLFPHVYHLCEYTAITHFRLPTLKMQRYIFFLY